MADRLADALLSAWRRGRGKKLTHVTDDGCTYLVGDAPQGRDSARVQHLIRNLLLAYDHHAILALDGHRCELSVLNRLHGVLDLVQPPLGREDGDVPVIPSRGSSPTHSRVRVLEALGAIMT